VIPDSKDIWDPRPREQQRDQLLAAAAFLRPLMHPWFERIWIVQEIGIATQALATCDRCEMDRAGWLVLPLEQSPPDGQNSSATKIIALNRVQQRKEEDGKGPGRGIWPFNATHALSIFAGL
jgi:hypothetical protein